LGSQCFDNNELIEGARNVAELTGGRLLWHRHTKTYSPIWQLPQFWRWLCWEAAYVCTYFLYTINNFFLIACFVNSSPEVTFRIAFVLLRACLLLQKPAVTCCLPAIG
jgi:hypothetical protein